MTKVFFYHGAPDKLAAASHLLGKASIQKKRVLVFAPDPSVADAVDRGLWAQSALTFYPHCRADSPLADETPILIADSLSTPAITERLMNLAPITPPGFERFEHLIEVVGQTEEDRQSARDRVREYKQHGCEIQYFDLTQGN